MCIISPLDTSSSLLRQTDLLVIDEVSMGHKYIFEAIDRTIRDIRGNNSLFGGMTVLMAGDWRHILPVVRHGSRPQINSQCSSQIIISMEPCQIIYLDKEHEGRTGESTAFLDYLLSVGNGQQNVC